MAWLDYEFDVNGQTVCARYRENTVRNLFLPLLANLSEIRRRTGERLVVFLAAPPAIGKSTLCCLLERLSSETRNLEPLRSVGIDGFHYPNAYLQNHAITVGKKRVLMREAKGGPETYDTGRLGKALRSLAAGEDVMWPAYSRRIHDVVEGDKPLTCNGVVVVEGNWLLLDEEPWKSMRRHADLTVFIRTDPTLLRRRLVERKVRGGLSAADAEAWYKTSDGPNVMRAPESSVPADINLCLCEDGDYVAERVMAHVDSCL